ADDAIIPNLNISHRYNEKFAIGFAICTNYGMETNLADDFNASHFGNEATVITKEANLNFAYQIDEQVSI
ncbi:outer membrane protein transport protein, partial [Vibrio echinoideorum]